MINSPIHVAILGDGAGISHRVVIWQQNGPDMLALTPTSVDNGEARWGWVTVEEGSVPPPCFPLPFSLVKRGVIQELVDEIAKDLGIVAQTVRASDSVIEAKQEHLEDLRRLLFGSAFVEIQRGEEGEKG